MSEYHDTIVITFTAGSGDREILQASYIYGKNPLDAIGAPEPPRTPPPGRWLPCFYTTRVKMFDPYLARLITIFEVETKKVGFRKEIYGPTTLLFQLWSKMVDDCKLIAITN